jgi:hypothetical protein
VTTTSTTSTSSTSTTTTTTTTTVPAAPPLPAAPPRPIRIVVVGDSTAVATSVGLAAWASDNPAYAAVAVRAEPGCGIIPDGHERASAADLVEKCREVRDRTSAELPQLQPDVVVGMVTLADLDDRTWNEAEGPLGPLDGRFTERLMAAYDAATAAYLAAGATDVLWIVPPVPAVPYGPDQRHLVDPARYDRYAQALHDVAAAHPGAVSVVDVRTWLQAQQEPPDRPDGLHWSPEGARRLADEFLAPVIVGAALSA